MMPLAPDFLVTLATQIGGVSAFLGGFAATFLAMFLTLGHESRAATIAITASAIASVAFIVAVVATTALIALLHPHAPAGSAASTGSSQMLMGLSFLTGMLALLVSLGASGWTRSRATGWTTSAVAAIGVVLTLLLVFA
ncbi:hypothetical protein [Sphingomonas sp. dw_22]|uniref:hypothetical protein n=1 Tax=Sphingomonas sp. dw_22 TaxID=2721175 RepID=UPI001BD4210D|nr:hypothetical protein [Sphingomonas sp. dw_22]